MVGTNVAHPSLTLGRWASANVTSPACLMKSFRSYTFTRKSASGARVQVPHIYKAGLISPKREAVSEIMRGIDRLVKKENSKNLRQKIQINKLLLFWGDWPDSSLKMISFFLFSWTEVLGAADYSSKMRERHLHELSCSGAARPHFSLSRRAEGCLSPCVGPPPQ